VREAVACVEKWAQDALAVAGVLVAVYEIGTLDMA
jgi:hypothetical protein